MASLSAEPLDLHDIALLLNYERASTEPRFRHAKLVELAAKNNDAPFSTFPEFKAMGYSTHPSRSGFLFLKDSSTSDEPDTPSNMLPDPVPASLAHLTQQQLETIFWQARGHDGCYKAVRLLQYLFNSYDPKQALRVRTTTGSEFTTTISNRGILEWDLVGPKQMTLAVVRTGAEPAQVSYISGLGPNHLHAVFGFAAPEDENIRVVLDLASMQVGDVGRGLKSNDMFALESMDQCYDRIEKMAESDGGSTPRLSAAIGPTPDDDWLEDVAKRAKERWEERETVPWCGHCGAPSLGNVKLKKCALCRVYYCNSAHQKLAWPFHKKFCDGKKATK